MAHVLYNENSASNGLRPMPAPHQYQTFVEVPALTDEILTYKTCAKCHVDKPISVFGKHKGGVGGRRARCNKCIREDNLRYALESQKIAPPIAPCHSCQESFPLADFYPDKSRKWGVSSACKTCTRARAKQFHATHRDVVLRRNKDYWLRHRGLALDHQRRLRKEVLRQYGGQCICCGESTEEFLSIDHVRNDGEKHRRELAGAGRSIYAWLRKNGYPKDGRFQLLCHNCNMAKGLYGGCPHQGAPPGRRPKTAPWKFELVG